MVIFLCDLYIFVWMHKCKDYNRIMTMNKMYRLYRKMTIYGHFSIQSIHLFWIQHGCLANTVFVLDPRKKVFIKKLLCISIWHA